MADLSEKEVLNRIFQDENKKFPVVDAEPSPKIEKEIVAYIEKVEREQFLQKPITDDFGQPLVSPPSPQQPKIVLPITKNQYYFGLTQKITESIRWLTTWCGRLIKIFGTRIIFRETN